MFSTEKYDPDLDTWTELKPMNVARRSPGVVAYRSKIYVVGGMGRHDDLKSAEVYDPILGTWSKFPYPMKQICGKIPESVGSSKAFFCPLFIVDFFTQAG